MSVEYFIIYNPKTGEEVMRGSGPIGACDLQETGLDRQAFPLPREAAFAREESVEALREAMLSQATKANARRKGPPTEKLKKQLEIESRINAATTKSDLFRIHLDGGE